MKFKLFLLTYILMCVTAFGQIISSPSATPNPICEGSALNLTANPTGGTAPYFYNWTGPNGFTSNLQNPVISAISLAGAGTYSLITTDSLGAVSTTESTSNIIVNAKIIPNFDGLDPGLCLNGQSPDLTTTSDNTSPITGTWFPTTVDSSVIGPVLCTFTPDLGQCASPYSITITVVNNVTPTFNFPIVLCQGVIPPPLPLTSNNGVQGTWSPPTITVSGNYLFTPNPGRCANTKLVAITVKPIITPTFDNIPTFVCFNGTVPTLPTQSTNSPSIAGTWSPLPVSNTITRTYTFTPTPVVGSCFANYTITINVNPIITPVINFNYPSPVCKNAANPAPNTAAGFTNNGLFSSTAGLVFVSTTTGVIDLNASSTGTYTVTYTVTADPVNCKLGATSTAIITINPIVTPVTGFSYTSPVCQNSLPNPSPILNAGFANNGTYSSTPGLVFASVSTGEINLLASTPGTYTITYSIAANLATCQIAGTNTATITIKPAVIPVSGFSYNSPVCQTQTSTILNPILVSGFTPGGTFTSSAGLILNSTTGSIDLTSAAATYTVTYTIAANNTNCFTTDATSTAQITINPLIIPVTGFSYITPVCKNALPNPSPILISGFTPGGTFSSTAGLVFVSNTTGQINLSASTAGIYVITYNVAAIPANCQIAGTNTATVEIKNNIVPVGGFSYTTPICKTNIILNPNLTSGFTIGGTFSAASGLDISASTGAINVGNSTTGTYTVTYTIIANATNCFTANSTTTAQIVINPTIIPVDGFSYTTPICQTQTSTILNPILVSGFTSGGIFTSTSGLIIDATNGAINLTSAAGTYTVTYTITATSINCFTTNSVSTAQITINPIITPVTGFSYTSPICNNSTPNPSPILNSGFTPGGTFTSTPGLNFISNTTGQINLATSTPGVYTVTYSIAAIPANCQLLGTNTAIIEIKPAIVPIASFGYTTPVCRTLTSTNYSPNLGAGFTSGGTFTSTSGLILNATTGVIDLTSLAATYTVTYSIVANGTNCFTANATSTAQIVINPIIIPVTGFTYPTPICKNSLTIMSPTLASGFTTLGTFSSTSGLDINATTGLINLSGSTAGTYLVSYNTLANTTTCQLAGLSTFTIIINPIVTPIVGFSYNTPICKNSLVNPSPILANGFATGGVFSSTAGLNIDPATGVITLSSSTVGTYTITYTLPENPALCRLAGISTTTITINTVINPVPNFSYLTPVCKNAGTANIVQGAGFTFGGIFSSTAGLSINSSTGIIDLTASTSGNYTINYTITANATNCFSADSSSTATITITPSTNSVTGFSYTTPVCKNGINPSPILPSGFTTGGTFSSTPGLVFVAGSNGVIDLNASTTGTYTVTYNYLNNIVDCINAGTNTANITINPTVNAVTGFSYNSPFCKNDANPSPIFVPGYTPGGTFSSSAGLVFVTASSGVIDLGASTAGTYLVTYTTTANTGTCLLAGNSTFSITINPMVSAVTTFSYTSPVCKDGVNPVPSFVFGYTTGGTFSSTIGLSINPLTGVINLANSAPATYTVKYETAANQATCLLSGMFSTTITITANIDPVNLFSYNSPICKNSPNQSPILGAGFTTGGIFSSTNSALVINPASGIIDLLATPAGNYPISYATSANNATCLKSGSGNATITINAVGTAVTTFSYTSPICKNVGTISPNTTAPGFTTGGTYTSTTGLSINPLTGVVDLANSLAGPYIIKYEVNLNTTNCLAGNSQFTLTITPPTVPTFNPIVTSICKNELVVPVLPTVSTNGTPINGTWSPAIVTSDVVGTKVYTFNPASTFCATSPQISITTFAPTTIPTFSVVQTICYKSNAPALPTTSTNGIAGTWLPATASNTETRTYEFTPTFGLCALKTSITITVIPEVVTEFKSECVNANYLLTVVPVNNSFNSATSTFVWKDGAGNIISNNSTSATLNVTNNLIGQTIVYPLTYSVIITTVDGCSSTSISFSTTDIYCDIQKGISPNGDNRNDFFDLSNLDVKQLEIYNRYGMKVFAKSGYKKEWEGQTDNGTLLPDGTYFYNIEFNNNEVKTGWVYINKETK